MNGGLLVDDRAVAARAAARLPQRAMGVDGAQPFVDESYADRANPPGQGRGIIAGLAGRGILHPGQAQGQPDDDLDHGVLRRERGDPVQVRGALPIAGHGLDGGREQAVGVCLLYTSRCV